jgi:hypothetical protein
MLDNHLFSVFNETFYILNDAIFIKTYNIFYGIVKYKNNLTENYKKQLDADFNYFSFYLGYITITSGEYLALLKLILYAYYAHKLYFFSKKYFFIKIEKVNMSIYMICFDIQTYIYTNYEFLTIIIKLKNKYKNNIKYVLNYLSIIDCNKWNNFILANNFMDKIAEVCKDNTISILFIMRYYLQNKHESYKKNISSYNYSNYLFILKFKEKQRLDSNLIDHLNYNNKIFLNKYILPYIRFILNYKKMDKSKKINFNIYKFFSSIYILIIHFFKLVGKPPGLTISCISDISSLVKLSTALIKGDFKLNTLLKINVYIFNNNNKLLLLSCKYYVLIREMLIFFFKFIIDFSSSQSLYSLSCKRSFFLFLEKITSFKNISYIFKGDLSFDINYKIVVVFFFYKCKQFIIDFSFLNFLKNNILFFFSNYYLFLKNKQLYLIFLDIYYFFFDININNLSDFYYNIHYLRYFNNFLICLKKKNKLINFCNKFIRCKIKFIKIFLKDNIKLFIKKEKVKKKLNIKILTNKA